jgi:hypothetical protein
VPSLSSVKLSLPDAFVLNDINLLQFLWHLMAPYGTLCSERYMNFTKQYCSLRFIIFVIFCITIPQILVTKQMFSVQIYSDVRDGFVGRS